MANEFIPSDPQNRGMSVLAACEPVAPHAGHSAFEPLVGLGPQCVATHREELGAVIEPGLTDPPGRQTASDGRTLVEHDHVVFGGERAGRDQTRQPGADHDDPHQLAFAAASCASAPTAW